MSYTTTNAAQLKALLISRMRETTKVQGPCTCSVISSLAVDLYRTRRNRGPVMQGRTSAFVKPGSMLLKKTKKVYSMDSAADTPPSPLKRSVTAPAAMSRMVDPIEAVSNNDMSYSMVREHHCHAIAKQWTAFMDKHCHYRGDQSRETGPIGGVV